MARSKRTPKMQKALRRREGTRALQDRILIVCEGTKTEPEYLRALLNFLGVNPARVDIPPNKGSSPVTVGKQARRLYDDAEEQANPYARVYCIFDRDEHGVSCDQALDQIRRAQPAGVFHAILSVPCFEYWFLLHFDFQTRPYAASGGKSACDRLIDDLRTHMEDYRKSQPDFMVLMPKLDRAIRHGKQSLHHAEQSGTNNPSTQMHQLAEHFKAMAAMPAPWE